MNCIPSLLTSPKALRVIREHVKFQYLYTEAQKKIFKYIFDFYDTTTKYPSIGMIGQAYSSDQEVISTLSVVKKLVIDNEQLEGIMSTLESFIIDSRFRLLYDRLGDLYNEGKKDEAIKLLAKESKEIQEFRIKDNYYSTVFSGFEERQSKRQIETDSVLLEKCTWGIHALDDLTRGGINKGTSALIMARSGVGKSTFLRWIGLCNARLGRRVVHFQAEGTERECLDAYDAGWTSIPLHDIEAGIMPEAKLGKILKAQSDIISNGGEIYVYASESFDTMSIEACREILLDIKQLKGDIDLVLFDYLEIFTVKGQFGNSETGERKRREDIANKITNIAVELKCATIAATQSMDVSPQLYNNEEFVMTRTHASEFKNIIKPFSQFVTLNQTDDEYENSVMRLWADKFRKYKKTTKVIRIFQSLNNSRFYDAQRTLELLYGK
jgi:replicative DNA helicase